MPQNLVWYAGRRYRNGKLVQLFVTPKGKEQIFSGVKNVLIGYAYEQDEMGRINTHPKKLAFEQHAKTDDWVAEDWNDEKEYKTDKAIEKVQNQPALKQEFKKFQELLISMKSYSVRHAFLEKILDGIRKEELDLIVKNMNQKLKRRK